MFNFKIILRNLRRNIIFSAINITGLAIGITAAVFIFMWVHHERSYDRYHTDAGSIYRIMGERESRDGSTYITSSMPYLLQSELEEFPEVERVASIVVIGDQINGIKVNNEVFPVAHKAVYLDPEWFDVFDYTLLEGSFAAFREHPYSVVLTRSEARKYFGNGATIGQTVGINGVEHTVQAVVADYPSNTNFKWEVIAAMDSHLANPQNKGTSESWRAFFYTIYIKLRPGANIDAIAQRINVLHTKNNEKVITLLQPLQNVYFNIEAGNTGKRNLNMVNLFSLLGLLLILTACVNYINLTTAKANTRTREVGVKKIIGAKRKELFMQFIAESFVVCCLAIAFSLLIIFILSPFYRLLAENAVLSFTSPVIWIVVTTILIVTTLLNGIYPALSLSSFKPMNFLKGIGLLKIKDGNLRKGLVVFQFTLSTTLIIYVMIINAQMNYIRQKDTGYNREHVISLRTPFYANNTMKLQAMLNEFQSEPAIIGATLCSHEITGVYASGGADWDGKDKDEFQRINLMGVDAHYQKTLGLEMLEGRWFEEVSSADKSNVILNETAIREFGIREPYIGQRFNCIGNGGQIIGVVKDFHYRSMRDKIEPLVIVQWSQNMMTMKTQPGQAAKALQAARAVWATHFPNDPFEYAYLDDSFNNLYQSEAKTSRLMLIFSVLAIIIALLGLFGLSTFAVERRFKEIGIRKILGASIGSIVNLLSKEFLILVSISMLIAFPLAYYWADKMLQDYAYRISIGWWIFALAGVITIALTLLTIGWQAIKAATSNPVDAIKTE